MAFNSFNWGKMNKTPEGNVARGEQLQRGQMTLSERVKTYERQASKDIEEHEDVERLIKDVEVNIAELNRGSDQVKEELAREIAHRHEKTISSIKGIDDEAEQIAYVLALAKAKAAKTPRLN